MGRKKELRKELRIRDRTAAAAAAGEELFHDFFHSHLHFSWKGFECRRTLPFLHNDFTISLPEKGFLVTVLNGEAQEEQKGDPLRQEMKEGEREKKKKKTSWPLHPSIPSLPPPLLSLSFTWTSLCRLNESGRILLIIILSIKKKMKDSYVSQG